MHVFYVGDVEHAFPHEPVFHGFPAGGMDSGPIFPISQHDFTRTPKQNK